MRTVATSATRTDYYPHMERIYTQHPRATMYMDVQEDVSKKVLKKVSETPFKSGETKLRQVHHEEKVNSGLK